MDKYTYFEKVYDIVREIPFGRITTYGAIHQCLAEGSARTVGWALNQLHDTYPDIPAHRVVNRKGELSGAAYFGGLISMEERLRKENIKVINNRVQDFRQLFWDPSIELLSDF